MYSPRWYNEETVCKNKRRYKTLIGAAKAAVQVDRKNDLESGRDTRPISVYECTLCGGYHWGHLPVNGRERKNPNRTEMPGQQTLFSFSEKDGSIILYNKRRRQNNQRYQRSLKRRKNPEIAFNEFREWVENRERI